jgi:hypothetical protein
MHGNYQMTPPAQCKDHTLQWLGVRCGVLVVQCGVMGQLFWQPVASAQDLS